MFALTLLGLLLSQAQLGSIFNSEGKWELSSNLSHLHSTLLCAPKLYDRHWQWIQKTSTHTGEKGQCRSLYNLWWVGGLQQHRGGSPNEAPASSRWGEHPQRTNTWAGGYCLWGGRKEHSRQRESKLQALMISLSGPVVKNPPCNELDSSLTAGWGTKIPHAAGPLSVCAVTREAGALQWRAHVLQQRPSPAKTQNKTTGFSLDRAGKRESLKVTFKII